MKGAPEYNNDHQKYEYFLLDTKPSA